MGMVISNYSDPRLADEMGPAAAAGEERCAYHCLPITFLPDPTPYPHFSLVVRASESSPLFPDSHHRVTRNC